MKISYPIIMGFILASYMAQASYIFTKDVPPQYLRVFKHDMKSDILNIPTKEWLSERLHYFTSSSENYLSNLGATLYLLGREQRNALRYSFETEMSQENLLINTPRVGLVQLGTDYLTQMASDIEYHPVNTVLRTALLIHEARHTDGHDKNAGFPHSRCPEDHPYAGYYACDACSNGPSQLALDFIAQARKSCLQSKKCDRADDEMLAIISLFHESRIVGDKPCAEEPEYASW